MLSALSIHRTELQMKMSREWATPLTMGAFFLSATTGVLLFFHLDSGLNKPAHEWLSWLMLAGVGVHASVNWMAFKRHFSTPAGRAILGVLLLITALSFWQPAGASRASPTRQASQALTRAPLDVVAQVAHREPAALRAALTAKGLTVPSGQPSLNAIAQASHREPVQVLGMVFEPAAAPK